MTLGFNTGTTAKVTASGTPSGTFAIPAGVLPGDLLYVAIMAFSTATGTLTGTLSSTATAPVAVGPQQATGVLAGVQVTTGLWSIATAAADPGATLTFGATGGVGGSYWFNAGLVAYTGALGTDVNGGNKEAAQGQTTGNITTPALTTLLANDWQLQIVAGGPPNGCDFTVPAGLTSREHIDHTGNAGLLLYMADSNGAVGPIGSAIGNTPWTTSVGASGANVMTSFTVGIAPPLPVAGFGNQQGGGRSMLRRWLDLADV